MVLKAFIFNGLRVFEFCPLTIGLTVGWGFQFVDAFQGGGGINMDITLRCSNFAMTHNFLHNTGLDTLFNEVCAGGVAATVGGQFSGAYALQHGIVFFVEIIFVDVNQLFTRGCIDQIFQHRKNGICQDNGCSLTDIGF